MQKWFKKQNINLKWINITFTVNAKLLNSQLNKLKSEIKTGTEVALIFH